MIVGGSYNGAFVWDELNGARYLKDVLINEFGLEASVANWSLSEATAISADGFNIVGWGYSPNGQYEAWIASLAPQALAGDYNGDQSVDAADYVVWRKGLGTIYTTDDFNTWRSNFGLTAGSGASLINTTDTPVVPEPTSIVLAISALSLHNMKRDRRPRC
jgi:uncharacterized membrane protein